MQLAVAQHRQLESPADTVRQGDPFGSHEATILYYLMHALSGVANVNFVQDAAASASQRAGQETPAHSDIVSPCS